LSLDFTSKNRFAVIIYASCGFSMESCGLQAYWTTFVRLLI